MKQILNPLGMTDEGYTHQKKPYKATCVQWLLTNTDSVVHLLEDAGAEVTPYGGRLMIRWRFATQKAGPIIEMLDTGMWLRIGESGVLKIMSDEEFKLKYEEI